MKNYNINNKNQNLVSFEILEKTIWNNFHQKYLLDNITYGSIIINNIIYNEKSHIVAIFKDFLISDDFSEFLKRFYYKNESLIRLPKFLEYYETYSKIYPNYTSLPESKFIYKNIHKKQKMIDIQQELESEEKKKNKNNNNSNKKCKEKIDKIFNTDIYDSIVNESEDLYNLLFGIDKSKNNNKKNNTSNSLKDFGKIINEIQKYDKDEIFCCNSLSSNISLGYSILNNHYHKPKNNILNKKNQLTNKIITKKINFIKKEDFTNINSTNSNTLNSKGNIKNNNGVLYELKLIKKNNTSSNKHRKTLSSHSNSTLNNIQMNLLKKTLNLQNIKINNNCNNNLIYPYTQRGKNFDKLEIEEFINSMKKNKITHNNSRKKIKSTSTLEQIINLTNNNTTNNLTKIIKNKNVVNSNNKNKSNKRKSNQKNIILNQPDFLFKYKINLTTNNTKNNTIMNTNNNSSIKNGNTIQKNNSISKHKNYKGIFSPSNRRNFNQKKLNLKINNIDLTYFKSFKSTINSRSSSKNKEKIQCYTIKTNSRNNGKIVHSKNKLKNSFNISEIKKHKNNSNLNENKINKKNINNNQIQTHLKSKSNFASPSPDNNINFKGLLNYNKKINSNIFSLKKQNNNNIKNDKNKEYFSPIHSSKTLLSKIIQKKNL